jgi:hypothetical protein
MAEAADGRDGGTDGGRRAASRFDNDADCGGVSVVPGDEAAARRTAKLREIDEYKRWRDRQLEQERPCRGAPDVASRQASLMDMLAPRSAPARPGPTPGGALGRILAKADALA